MLAYTGRLLTPDLKLLCAIGLVISTPFEGELAYTRLLLMPDLKLLYAIGTEISTPFGGVLVKLHQGRSQKSRGRCWEKLHWAEF